LEPLTQVQPENGGGGNIDGGLFNVVKSEYEKSHKPMCTV